VAADRVAALTGLGCRFKPPFGPSRQGRSAWHNDGVIALWQRFRHRFGNLMKTDTLFYRVFQELPGLVFELAGWPVPAGAVYTLHAEEVKRAYLLVGGGDHCREETIKALVDPCQAEMEQMVEPRFAPAHAHPFKALLNEPLASALHHATTNRQTGRFELVILDYQGFFP
jgi:hypothetical protein